MPDAVVGLDLSDPPPGQDLPGSRLSCAGQFAYPTGWFRADYSANGGSVPIIWMHGPDSYAEGLAGQGFWERYTNR